VIRLIRQYRVGGQSLRQIASQLNQHLGTYFQRMELPTEKAVGEGEDLTKELDVCLPIVLGEGTILVEWSAPCKCSKSTGS
jgi:hypothetical protein